MTRPAPPELILQEPLCSVCEETVGHDDVNYWCEQCGATWPLSPYEPGEWPASERQCASVDGRYLPGGWLGAQYGEALIERRCILADGHPYDHTHVDAGGQHYRWETHSQATSAQLAAISAAVKS